MTDENLTSIVPPPSLKDDDERLALHSQEAEQLRLRIADLLSQVEGLRAATKSKDALEALVLRLRKANQNLIIATFDAQDMRAAAEAANRRQEEFLSMLAHELRNPLAPVAMAAELLGKITDAHPQLPKLHWIIRRQVSHMTRMVDDLLDASRFSGGKIALQKSALRLSEVIDSAAETIQPFVEKRHQILRIELPDEPILVDGDHVRLAQLFSNLLINASKFSPEYETIAVTVRRIASGVAVSVKDNGVGIAPDIQPLIFDLFTQGFHSLDRSQGGLGIGLSLVRTIAEMHGGSVKAKSEGTGFGSEFIVQLPVSSVSPAGLASVAPKSVPPRYSRILLIEDNADASETLKDLLVLEGHTVMSAANGVVGLAMARASSFDVIICDIGLPGMDGYEVIRQVRLHASSPMPCLIALSGYNQVDNKSRAIAVGFDHYLVKPIASEVLLKLIATCAHR